MSGWGKPLQGWGQPPPQSSWAAPPNSSGWARPQQAESGWAKPPPPLDARPDDVCAAPPAKRPRADEDPLAAFTAKLEACEDVDAMLRKGYDANRPFHCPCRGFPGGICPTKGKGGTFAQIEHLHQHASSLDDPYHRAVTSWIEKNGLASRAAAPAADTSRLRTHAQQNYAEAQGKLVLDVGMVEIRGFDPTDPALTQNSALKEGLLEPYSVRKASVHYFPPVRSGPFREGHWVEVADPKGTAVIVRCPDRRDRRRFFRVRFLSAQEPRSSSQDVDERRLSHFGQARPSGDVLVVFEGQGLESYRRAVDFVSRFSYDRARASIVDATYLHRELVISGGNKPRARRYQQDLFTKGGAPKFRTVALKALEDEAARAVAAVEEQAAAATEARAAAEARAVAEADARAKAEQRAADAEAERDALASRTEQARQDLAAATEGADLERERQKREFEGELAKLKGIRAARAAELAKAEAERAAAAKARAEAERARDEAAAAMSQALVGGADAAEIARLKAALEEAEDVEMNLHMRYHVKGADEQATREKLRAAVRDDPDVEKLLNPTGYMVSEANDESAVAWRRDEDKLGLANSLTHQRVLAALKAAGKPAEDKHAVEACDVMDCLVRDENLLPTKRVTVNHVEKDVIDVAYDKDFGTTADYKETQKEFDYEWRHSLKRVRSFGKTPWRDVIPRFRGLYGDEATAILVEKLNERVEFSAFYPTMYPWHAGEHRELKLSESVETLLRENAKLRKDNARLRKEAAREAKGRGVKRGR